VPALAYIAVCLVFGRLVLAGTAGPVSRWWSELQGKAERPLSYSGTIPAQLAVWSGALWIGLISVTWLVYFLACFFNKIMPLSGPHPLLPANLTALAAVSIIICLMLRRQRHRGNIFHSFGKRHDWKQPEKASDSGVKADFDILRRQITDPSERRQNIYVLSVFTLLIIFSVWLMCSDFYIKDGSLAAGYSIFSDFAPHTALVSSFSEGRNWPTQYPHFAGDGISYHFMFYFLCGNLTFLGLPLDIAINLPSVLGMVSCFVLLGSLALVLTGRLAAWGMVMLLTLARSSMAAFTYLGDLFRKYGIDPAAWLNEIRYQRVFIGNTPRDDWGLWSVNVYANQRHLLPGLSVMLLIILLFLPAIRKRSVESPANGLIKLKQSWFGPGSWLPANDQKHLIPGFLLAAALLVMLPYWHGSSLIATLLILSVLAVFSGSRIYFLLSAIMSIISSALQVRFFSDGAQRIAQPRITAGFLAETNSMVGILTYLAEMMGIALPLILLTLLLPGRTRKITLSAALLPLVFAFIISLTPDVTVNHKYVMIAIMLCNIWLADLIIMLWQNGKAKLKQRGSFAVAGIGFESAAKYFPIIARRILVMFMIISLTLTGFLEWRIFSNINQMDYRIRMQSPMLAWIKKNTDPQAIFVTAPYHYNSFYLSGRGTWLGHSYYAWSAGHDTAGRFEAEKWLLAGADGSAYAAADFARSNNIDYILIDDTLRNHEQFEVNEKFFSDNFDLAAAFPAEDNVRIYDIGRRID
jgi:hypothetical protein